MRDLVPELCCCNDSSKQTEYNGGEPIEVVCASPPRFQVEEEEEMEVVEVAVGPPSREAAELPLTPQANLLPAIVGRVESPAETSCESQETDCESYVEGDELPCATGEYDLCKSYSMKDGKPRSLLDFMSLDESEIQMLRASCLTLVLERRGAIFQCSSGNEETYALSRPDKNGVQIFISHNWVMPGRDKFLALSWTFNRRLAFTAWILSQLVCMGFTSAGFLPGLPQYNGPALGFACRAVGIPVFLGVLLLGGDIRKCAGIRGPSVFVDKLCINQADKEVQQAGIRKLGAFLTYSKTMVVLYHTVYLTRIWTVYEFACFLCSHPIQDLRLVPPTLAQASIATLGLCFFLQIVIAIMEANNIRWSTEIGCVLLGPILGRVFRLNARERALMQEQLKEFDVNTCTCSSEEDRPLVLRNIGDLMRRVGMVPSKASQEQALQAFNVLARVKLPPLIDKAVGNPREKYMEFITFSILFLGSFWCDKQPALFSGELPWQRAVFDALQLSTGVFMTAPLGFALMATVTQQFLHLGDVAEVVLLCFASLLGVIVPTLSFTLMNSLRNHSSFEDTGQPDFIFGLVVAVEAFFASVTVCVFGGPQLLGGGRSRGPGPAVALKKARHGSQLWHNASTSTESSDGPKARALRSSSS